MESIPQQFERKEGVPRSYFEGFANLVNSVKERTKSKLGFAALGLMAVSTGCAEVGAKMREVGGALTNEMHQRSEEVRSQVQYTPAEYSYSYNAGAGLSAGVEGVHVDTSINRSVTDLRAKWERDAQNPKHK